MGWWTQLLSGESTSNGDVPLSLLALLVPQLLTEAARAGCMDQEHEQFGFDDLDGRLAAERTLDARLAELEALASSEAQHASFARKPEDLHRRRPDTGASKAEQKVLAKQVNLPNSKRLRAARHSMYILPSHVCQTTSRAEPLCC